MMREAGRRPSLMTSEENPKKKLKLGGSTNDQGEMEAGQKGPPGLRPCPEKTQSWEKLEEQSGVRRTHIPCWGHNRWLWMDRGSQGISGALPSPAPSSVSSPRARTGYNALVPRALETWISLPTPGTCQAMWWKDQLWLCVTWPAAAGSPDCIPSNHR